MPALVVESWSLHKVKPRETKTDNVKHKAGSAPGVARVPVATHVDLVLMCVWPLFNFASPLFHDCSGKLAEFVRRIPPKIAKLRKSFVEVDPGARFAERLSTSNINNARVARDCP